jgi:hypothetical protein
MANALLNLSVKELKRAIRLKERMEKFEHKLAALLGGSTPAADGRGGRRTMSASARKRIAAAQRLRWAKQKGTKVRRKMSAAGRARIAAAARKRWAKVKAAGGRTLAG